MHFFQRVRGDAKSSRRSRQRRGLIHHRFAVTPSPWRPRGPERASRALLRLSLEGEAQGEAHGPAVPHGAGGPGSGPACGCSRGAGVRWGSTGLRQQVQASSTVPRGQKLPRQGGGVVPGAGGGVGAPQAAGPAVSCVCAVRTVRASAGRRWAPPCLPGLRHADRRPTDARRPVRSSHLRPVAPAQHPRSSDPPPPAPKWASRGDRISQLREFGSSSSRCEGPWTHPGRPRTWPP